MKYQKPEVIAKSAAKESFVAGCPTETAGGNSCGAVIIQCQVTAIS